MKLVFSALPARLALGPPPQAQRARLRSSNDNRGQGNYRQGNRNNISSGTRNTNINNTAEPRSRLRPRKQRGLRQPKQYGWSGQLQPQHENAVADTYLSSGF